MDLYYINGWRPLLIVYTEEPVVMEFWYLQKVASVALFFSINFLHIRALNSKQTTPLFPAVIVFGDSIVDPGNNNDLLTVVKCNFPPYGKDFINHTPTGRFSNGKITADFIASKLGVKELLPAYKDPKITPSDLLTGVSFASGGTGYDNLTAHVAAVTSLPNQLEMFKEYKETLSAIAGETDASSIIANSLYIVCAGSNDLVMYFSTPSRRTAYNISSYADALVQDASAVVQELVNLGAQKIAIFGAPPVGCVPSQRTLAGGIVRDCVPDRNQLAQLYNSELSIELQRLTNFSRGHKLVYIDIYSPLLDLIQHPTNFGFENSTGGCCGVLDLEVAILCNSIITTTCPNVSSYVFWDSYHPTERACEVLVDKLLQEYLPSLE